MIHYFYTFIGGMIAGMVLFRVMQLEYRARHKASKPQARRRQPTPHAKPKSSLVSQAKANGWVPKSTGDQWVQNQEEMLRNAEDYRRTHKSSDNVRDTTPF